MFFKSLPILFVFLLLSCGQDSPKRAKRTIKLKEESINYIVENQSFSCDAIDRSSCPSGIARLFIFNRYRPEKSSVCSGFMVSKNVLVTNNHCVRNSKDCKNTYIAIYNGYSHETVRCKSIIATGRDYKNPNDPRKKLDFTVMKISQEYLGDFFGFKSKAPRAGNELSAWVVDHTGLDKINGNPFESRITQFKCKVSPKGKYNSVILRNCPIISGNSGSPLIDEDNKVVGIIWGSANSSLSASTPLILRRSRDTMALATDIKYFYKHISKLY